MIWLALGSCLAGLLVGFVVGVRAMDAACRREILSALDERWRDGLADARDLMLKHEKQRAFRIIELLLANHE